jgi:DNA invertase Pin-like site-specific DNA recombinase
MSGRVTTIKRPALVYIRVSTESQNLGLEAQLSELRTFAMANELDIVGIFEDRISGASPIEKRSGFVALLEALDRGDAGLVLIQSRDRLARSVVVAMAAAKAIKDRGAYLLAVDVLSSEDTPTKEFARAFLELLAEYRKSREQTPEQ